ncbi:MAG: hypothetical protein IKD04_00190 [Clostridia bacterium]|nr:hypothetical protein [Clostridia bacterium]
MDLIENKNVEKFYVGNHGSFDSLVIRNLEALETIYPHIKYSIVLAYLTGKKSEYHCFDFSRTLYPDGLEKTPPKFAIDKRNRWMIEKSDFVVTYVKRFGGAYNYKEIAEKKGKIIINIADLI